jgi:hypothetical protein
MKHAFFSSAALTFFVLACGGTAPGRELACADGECTTSDGPRRKDPADDGGAPAQTPPSSPASAGVACDGGSSGTPPPASPSSGGAGSGQAVCVPDAPCRGLTSCYQNSTKRPDGSTCSWNCHCANDRLSCQMWCQ